MTPPAETSRERALATYTAMQQHLYQRDGSFLYLEAYPRRQSDPRYSYEWPFSQARAATIDLCRLPGTNAAPYLADLRERDAGQTRYWSGIATATGLPGYRSSPVAPFGPGGDVYYDDNAWVGLLDMQLFELFGNTFALDRARRIFALLASGWDTDPSSAAPGGVFWTQASWSTDRNTVSNMPAAALGLHLYKQTREQAYLDWALRMYEWTNQHLLAPNGLYWDHLNHAGMIEKTQWSYNSGVPVGVNLLLAQITGDDRYRQRAEHLALAALAFYGDALDDQPPYFNAIFFKHLLHLLPGPAASATHAALQAYAERMWTQRRDPTTGLFSFERAGTTTLLEQAAMVQIYAALAREP